ncbi:MAG: glycoside hydrolase family 3 protein [Cytophagia bacterium]|nr:glycoside hydrolase family 3 protein [Cytophagia bacterium]
MKLFFTCLLCAGVMSKSLAQTDSLSIKIGQMLLIGFADTKVDEKVLKEIKDGKVGSVIIFEKNIPKTNSYIGLKKIVWTYQQAATIPLFIAIDQEGGRVNRLKEKYGFPRSVSASYAGKSKSLDTVRFYAEATAATLAGLGININFAPTVDLATNPNNPIIAKVERSYSANEDTVSMMAKVFIEEHRKLGIITVLKHFPGHGSSKDDTHLGIADVTNTWDTKELTPYKKLLNEGYVDGVMSAHIVNKKLDARGLPGTLSDSILGKVLRQEIGYQGVVFSDDMQMHAITKHYGLEEAIKLAILAGIDIMTFSNNISGSEERTVDKVHGIIKKLVQQGTISEQRIDESFKRIMALKKSFTFDKAYYQKEVLRLQYQATTKLKQAQQNEKEARKQVSEERKKEIQEIVPEKTTKKKRNKNK